MYVRMTIGQAEPDDFMYGLSANGVDIEDHYCEPDEEDGCTFVGYTEASHKQLVDALNAGVADGSLDIYFTVEKFVGDMDAYEINGEVDMESLIDYSEADEWEFVLEN